MGDPPMKSCGARISAQATLSIHLNRTRAVVRTLSLPVAERQGYHQLATALALTIRPVGQFSPENPSLPSIDLKPLSRRDSSRVRQWRGTFDTDTIRPSHPRTGR